MLRRAAFVLAISLGGGLAESQVPVAPATIPHVTFVDTSGGPCAGCKLSSFAAGTTTPLATFVDAGGVSTNTNPITLDAAGGANVWLSNNSYKFVLKTAAGATVWTVDQVRGGGGLGGVCGPSGAVQIANGAVNGLTCDSTITINTAAHTLNVGTLPANHVSIGALSNPTSWSFDTTSPATACASIGCAGVTSVGLTVPSWLSVAGSPVTSSGVLAVTAAGGQTANQFLAAPDGSTGILAPRAITPNDLPLGSTSAFGAMKCDGTTVTCPGGVLSTTSITPRTCNSDGCYITFSDGTILQWGEASGCISSNNSCTTVVSFPTSFTTTTNLTVVDSCHGWGNCGASVDSPATTGFAATQAPFVYVGGSGANLPGSQTVDWWAVGH